MKENNLAYRSFSVKLFDTWRIFFFGTALFLIVFGIVFQELMMTLVVSGVLSLLIVIIHIGSSYSEVTFDGRSLRLVDLTKTIQLSEIKKMSTWWCYEFGGASIELTGDVPGTTRMLTNKINVFVKFEGENETVYIYEQIHLGSKFPNGHEYRHNESVDRSRMVRVWDVDNCLKKLGLESGLLT